MALRVHPPPPPPALTTSSTGSFWTVKWMTNKSHTMKLCMRGSTQQILQSNNGWGHWHLYAACPMNPFMNQNAQFSSPMHESKIFCYPSICDVTRHANSLRISVTSLFVYVSTSIDSKAIVIWSMVVLLDTPSSLDSQVFLCIMSYLVRSTILQALQSMVVRIILTSILSKEA